MSRFSRYRGAQGAVLALLVGLTLGFLPRTSPVRAEIASLSYPTTVFRPNEPGPTRSTRAELRVLLDASPSRYRIDVFREGSIGALLESLTVDHPGPVGTAASYGVRVPLEEGDNTFTVRVVDRNQGRNVATLGASPVLTRDLKNTLTSIVLDRIEPTSVRVASQTTAELVYTIRGISESYAVEIEQNGVVVALEPDKLRGESRSAVTLEEGENFFRVRATSTDPLSNDPAVTSKVLRMIRDTTPPTLTGLVVANPPLPTDQAVVTIQGNTEAFATVRVSDGLGNVFTKRADQLGNFSLAGVELPLVLPGPTTTLFQVTATDEAGNVSDVASLSATRNAADTRFDFLRLTPVDGAQVLPDVAAQIDGVVGLGQAPYRVEFYARRGPALPLLEENIQVLGDLTPFQKDILLTSDPGTPGLDVLWSFQAQATSTSATTPLHTLGSLLVDFTDPAALEVLDSDLIQVPTFGSRSFTIEGAAERASSVQFVGFNGVRILPTGLIPTNPSLLSPGGEFRAVIDLTDVADGLYSLSTTVVATSGRTGPFSRRDLRFMVDRTSPRVVDLTIDQVDSETGRLHFFLPGDLVDLRVRVDEFMVEPPEVYVTQQGAEAVRAVFTQALVEGFSFQYLAAVENSQDFDGPVEVVVLGGEDRGGNPVLPEQRFPAAYHVDSRAPILDGLRSFPLDGSLITGRPDLIRVVMVEPPDSVLPASGPDPAGSSLEIKGPLETQPDQVQAGQLTAFDSVTLDFIPAAGTFLQEGTYQMEVQARDHAGNTFSSVFLYVLDSTPPGQDFVLATEPSAGQVVATTGMPLDTDGHQFVAARFEVTAPDDLDLEQSRISLRSGCPVPYEVQGEEVTFLPDTRRFVLEENLVGDGSDDGVYTIRATAADPAGNLQLPVLANFIVDNIPPVALTGLQRSFPGSDIPTTENIFPLDQALVSGPLRQVSSLIQDGIASSGFTGSGVSTDPQTGTQLELTLLEAHPTATIPVGTSTANGVITTLTFEVLDLSGASPCYLGPLQSRALLDLFPDPLSGEPVGLPADGSFDGVWQLAVTPVDRAGNVGTPHRTRFTYDTVAPFVELDDVRDGRVLTGNRLQLTGRARDNDKGPFDLGLGLERVQVRLEAQGPTGIVTLPPLIDYTDVTLTPSPELVQAEEELPWRVDVRIPAYSGLARLIVRAEDMAGNETLLARTLELDVDPLDPPRLNLPANRVNLPGGLVPFDWEHVEGASQYALTLTDANGNESEWVVDFPFRRREVLLSILPEGRYTWTVTAIDTRGTRGQPALARSFYLDRTLPEVSEVFAFDGTVPDAAMGDIYGAQVRLAVTFSEAMDTTTPPTVLLDPDEPGVEPLAVTQIQFVDQEYRGVVQIPMTPDFPDVNGLATVIVRDARDRAGNPLVETRRHLEIDVGPYWEVRAFANPILEREILFYFKARESERGGLEDVLGTPHIQIEQENATRPRFLQLRQLGPSIFQGTYEVDQTLPGNARIEITSSDPQGNSSTRTLSFSIAAITRSARTRFQGTSSALRIFVPEEAVAQDRVVTMLPASMEVEDTESSPHPELEMVRPLDKMVPGQLDLARASLLEVDLEELGVGTPATWDGLGVYLREGEGYRYMPGDLTSGKLAAVVDRLGSFALMRDPRPPRLRTGETGGARAGSVLEIEVEEEGSGVDPASLRARLGGRSLAPEWDASRGTLRLSLPRGARSGEVLELELADQQGNRGTLALPVVAATGSLSEASLYPNPARGPVRLRVRLASAVTSLEARIYDSAGRRLRTLRGSSGAGLQTLTWDLRTRRGRRVRNGVYFVVVEVRGAGGERERRRLKLAVLR